MTDTPNDQPKEQVATENPVEVLRNEFQAQFTAMRESFDAQLKQLTSENESLKTQNNDLQRALVRSATVPATEQPAPKTEEQLYAEQIDALAKKTLQRMCSQ